MDEVNWNQRLGEIFPDSDSADKAEEWAALRERLSVDQVVDGTVVAKAPFGAWIDLGVGFPALLLIDVMEGLTPEKYRDGDWCPIGSRVTAKVSTFVDQNRQIGLWQIRRGK
jgi:ribosomal protein S1